MAFSPIDEILEDLKRGRFVIVVDDESRENEGDLTLPAQFATPDKVSFLLNQARGLVCVAIDGEVAKQLDLQPMVPRNLSRYQTPFTVSIDARDGITTGVSAADRSHTVRLVAEESTPPEELVRPGHVFPLEARPGGTLVRAGHTEAAVDLVRLAGLRPAAVVCEVVTREGTMARLPELERLAEEHDLKICTIADIIEYRRRTECLISKLVTTSIPTRHGDFTIHLYRSLVDDYQHIAVCAGDIGTKDGSAAEAVEEPVLVRVHDECFTGEILGSLRCDCREQLEMALKMIQDVGRGVVLYMRQEGRGIGLVNKLKAYCLQDRGLDTVEANEHLGLPADRREYGIGAQILRHLGLRKLRLMTNNPRKYHALNGYGLEIVERIPLQATPRPENLNYLKTKRDKLGHDLELPDKL